MIKTFENFNLEDDPYNEEDWGLDEEWKKGDVVICVFKENLMTLTLNKEYILIKDEFIAHEDGEIFVRVNNDAGYDTDYFKRRFRKK